ncbi:MAG TPA: ferrous iron transporter B [Peptococcaceae bacterium]|nr:ferrous iron transporter B [Peptococcaceae bacterium]
MYQVSSHGSLNNALDEIYVSLPPEEKNALRDRIAGGIYSSAERIAGKVVSRKGKQINWDQKIDDVLTSRCLGIPVMLLLLGVVLWLTVTGANYPSQILASGLFRIEDILTGLFVQAGAPAWLHGLLVEGAYLSLAWVVSVMLPPMAIFFPLFTIMEDLGYLPRVAFNLDKFFRRAGAHGKQSLTMSMGFGCNAAGVISCRIIESPRERLIAVLTNSFIPCNGRFPTLIILSTLFMGGTVAASFRSAAASLVVVGLVLTGITVTLLVSRLLTKTLLRGEPSFFILELPPYRKPQVGRIIIRSVLDRTLFVLGRAVVVAIPAGALTWILANTFINDLSLLSHAAGFLDSFGRLLGMDGFILMAFILGLPANEIVLPILLMSYVSAGTMVEPESLAALHNILVVQNGWTWLTALSVMLFSLLHYPCGTTLLTIFKETRSLKWTLIALLMPLSVALLVTFTLTQAARLLGLA